MSAFSSNDDRDGKGDVQKTPVLTEAGMTNIKNQMLLSLMKLSQQPTKARHEMAKEMGMPLEISDNLVGMDQDFMIAHIENMLGGERDEDYEDYEDDDALISEETYKSPSEVLKNTNLP